MMDHAPDFTKADFTIEEKDFPERHFMYIKKTVPYEEMRDLKWFHMKLGIYAFTRRAKPTYEVFVRYTEETKETITLEVCFGVEELLKESKHIKAMTIPAHRAKLAIAYHKGPREFIPGVYGEFGKWFAEQGLERTGPMLEYMLNSPREVPQEELLTQLHWPIA